DLGDLVPYRGVGDVEVGLVPVEAVQVPLPRALVVAPDAALLVGEHDLGRRDGRLRVAPHVEVAGRVVRAAARGIEPRVLRGRVVDNEVDDHAHAPVACGAQPLHDVAVVAQPRVDAVVVDHVVPVVALGRRVEGHEPQARDAQLGEVVDAL